MHTVLENLGNRLKNSVPIQKFIDALLNKYIFFVFLGVTAFPVLFKNDRLFSRLLPENTDRLLTILVNAVICMLLSIMTAELVKKYSSGNRTRLYFVFLTVCASGVLNAPEMRIFDFLAICFLYFIFGLILLRGVNLFIPLLIFFVILLRPVLTVPLIPYAVYILTHIRTYEREMQKKLKIVTISCIAVAAAALVLYAVVSGDKNCFAVFVIPQSGSIFELITDIPKTGIVLIIFSCFICLDSRHLKHIPTVSMIITLVIFLLNPSTNRILFSYLMMQSIVLLGIFHKSVYQYVTDTSKSKKAVFTVTALIIFLEQLLFTFAFSSSSFGSQTFRITPFYICYQDLGFVQRGLFGTVFRLLLGTHISENLFFSAYFISYLLLKILFFLLIVRTMHYADSKEEHSIVMLFIFAFLISPGFDKHYFEMFHYIMAWLCVFLSYRNKQTVYLIPLLCLLAMLTHQVFASIIFPVVFIVLVYRAFIDSHGHTARNTVILTATLLVVGIGFFYLTFCNAGSIRLTYEQIYDRIDEISGGFFTPHEGLIKYVYLDTGHDHTEIFRAQIQPRQIVSLCYAFAINVPALAVYIYSFGHSAKKARGKGRKLAYIISLLSILAIIPVFISETDYGRWFSQYVSLLILAPLILAMLQTHENKWYRDINKKEFCIVGILLILSMLIQPNFQQQLYYYSVKFF